MSQKLDASYAVIGIDIGENSFHIVGQNPAVSSCCGRNVGCGHVWTAPGWQEESSLCGVGRCGHVFGLSARGSVSFRETFVARLYSFRSIGL